MKNEIIEFLDIRKGRMHRFDYFIICLLLSGLSDLLDVLFSDPGTIEMVVLMPINGFQMYMFSVVTARRLRDINISGWFSIPVLLLHVAFIFIMKLQKLNKEEQIFDPALISNMFSVTVAPVIIVGLSLLFIPPQKKDNKYGPYVTKSFLG